MLGVPPGGSRTCWSSRNTLASGSCWQNSPDRCDCLERTDISHQAHRIIDFPHSGDLPERARLVLDQHDLCAEWTIYLAGIWLVGQLVSQFLLKGKRWSVLAVALILTGAAYCVAMEGH